MWCLVVFLVTCGFMLACRGHALGVAAGPCLRGVFLRVVLRAPDGGAERRCALVCAGCVGGSVGVAAFGGMARARSKNDG